ncbi:MAG: RNA 2',3'-cyclic phosphodiesterase [Actinobacteria bacterium HGW-Actinobacteria-5]|nr:MAG: RNA 2',3'-cyclic phosphodiesterase [Actinobacteria bacterium HGW-Actinobacteria-5]
MSDRLFVAVVPPRSVVDAIDDFLEPRRDAGTAFRWTEPEGWHLTCAFLPAVESSRIEPLEEVLEGVAGRTRPFAVQLAGAGAFPDADRAKALWLGVPEGSEDLARLARRCRNAAVSCGVVVDGGRFHPHLTLARTRPFAARRWLTILDAIPEQAWGVEEFVLVRSRLLAGGAGYETLRRFPLAG